MTASATPFETSLRLETAAPFAGAAVVAFLAARAVTGVEVVHADGTYCRAVRLPHGPGTLALSPTALGVDARIAVTHGDDLALVVDRARHLFDLDAPSDRIDAHLGADPLLSRLVAALPGRRSPGAVDGAEILVRAIIGQQVSVAGARTILGRLAATHGEGLPPMLLPDPDDPDDPDDPGSSGRAAHDVVRCFPSAGALAEMDPADLPMPRSRALALTTALAKVADGTLVLDPSADPSEVEAGLLSVAGIGPWTAAYVAMRALGDPDVFLPTDVAVKRALLAAGVAAGPRAAARLAERWRPWRSYALHHLWSTV